MRAFFALFTGSLCYSSMLFSQAIPFTIQKSAEFEDSYKKSNIVLTKEDNNGGFEIVRSFKFTSGVTYEDGFYIERYDAQLNLLKNFEFKMTRSNSQKYKVVLGVASFENNIVIAELFYDLNEKAYICKANVIDSNDAVTQKELFRLSKEEVKKLGEMALEHDSFVQLKKVFSYDNSGDINSEVDNYSSSFFNFDQTSAIRDEAPFNLSMTTNESNTAFGIAVDFYGDKSEYLKLYLFDDQLNKKIDSEFKRDIEDDAYFFQNFQVSPEGNTIYLLAKSYSKEFKKKVKGGKYQFELTKITAASQQSVFIDPNQHYIYSLKTIFQKNQLICLGFYSDLKDSQFQGISYFSFDPNSLESLNAKYNPFSQQFMTDKYGDKKQSGLKYLNFKKVFFTKNNDLIFNAEEQYTRTSFNASPTGMSGGGQTYYIYDDIVTAKLNSTGDLIWARNINKDQSPSSEENALYVSYSSMVKGDYCYFFINTAEKLKKLSNNRIEFGDTRKNKSNLNIIRVNSNGDFDYQEILDSEQNPIPFMVMNGIQSGDSIFFMGRKGKEKQLLKITL